MKLFNSAVLFLFLLNACQTDLSSSEKEDSSILGTWKLVYGEVREGESLDIKDIGKSDFIKIINKSHFAFFNQDYDAEGSFYGGAGKYTLEGNKYTEYLDYTDIESYRGHSFPFTIEVNSDSLIQYGTEIVEDAGINRYIIEKYIRMKE